MCEDEKNHMKIIRKLWKFLCLVGRGLSFWCEYHFLDTNFNVENIIMRQKEK